jgi:hypothetical protein
LTGSVGCKDLWLKRISLVLSQDNSSIEDYRNRMIRKNKVILLLLNQRHPLKVIYNDLLAQSLKERECPQDLSYLLLVQPLPLGYLIRSIWSILFELLIKVDLIIVDMSEVKLQVPVYGLIRTVQLY